MDTHETTPPPPAGDTHEELITLLIGAMGQRSLFYRAHPRVQCAVADFVRGLKARLAADGASVFFLGIVDGRLVHDGRLLFGSTLLGRKLIVFAERLHCGGFLFRATLTEDDVLALLDLYAELRGPVANLVEARGRLATPSGSIQLSPPYEDPDWFGQFVYDRTESWDEAGGAEGQASMTEVFQSLFDVVDTSHGRAAADGVLDVNAARTSAEKLLASADGRMHDVLRLVRYPTPTKARCTTSAPGTSIQRTRIPRRRQTAEKATRKPVQPSVENRAGSAYSLSTKSPVR